MPPEGMPCDTLASLTKHIAQFAPSHDRDGSFPQEAFAEFARRGLLARPPIQQGKIWQLLELLVAVGTGDLSAGRIFEGHANTVWLIDTFGAAASRTLAATPPRFPAR